MESVNRIWRRPPRRLTLRRDDVHVWRADLDVTDDDLQSLSHGLAPDERERARRFRFPRDRRHFIAARGVLREILSRYLGVPAGDVRFQYGSHGKPALEDALGRSDLNFSLSHSLELALCAVTLGRAVGIDLEWMRKDLASKQVAERFFSPHEVSTLCTLPESMQIEGFFNCWTRKEAYVKALGEGLSFPLDRFEVSLTPGEPARLISTADGKEWSMQTLSPGAGFVAALVVEGRGRQLRCWRWP